MIGARLTVDWTPRGTPLAVVACAATGEVARQLGRRLLTLDDAHLAALAAVAGPRLLVVTGPELPWVDGVVYLGRDVMAPELLLPTALEPSVPPALLAAALLRRQPGPPPIAVLPATLQLVSLVGLRALDRVRLQAWVDGA